MLMIDEQIRAATINKIDEMREHRTKKRIDDMLYAWAHWVAQDFNGLGYQSPNLLMPRAKPTFPRPIPINDEVDAMEKMLRALTIEKSVEAKTLIEYYLKPDIPCEVHAKRFGISLRTFRDRISCAKDWLCGYYNCLTMHTQSPKIA